MKIGFQKIYLCAIVALLSSENSMGQVHPHHSNSHGPDFWTSFSLNAGEAHFQQKQIEQKKFLAEMPTQPEGILKYLVEILNRGTGGLTSITYEIVELPVGTKQAEPSYELNFTEQKTVAQIKVHPEYLKNPLYILDAMLMMEHLFKEGFYAMSSETIGYHNVPGYYHVHHKEYFYDHSKKKLVHYHTHAWNSLTSIMGVVVNSAEAFLEPLKEAELKTNASLGSVYAQKELAKQQESKLAAALDNYRTFNLIKTSTEIDKKKFISEMAALHNVSIDSSRSSDEMAAEYFNERKARYHSQVQALDKAARERYRFERNLLANPDKKAEKEQLEKMSLKLNDLLMNNDRAGVANLLEAYLPFEVMEPVEKGIWNDWIDAIRDPKKENSVVLYRGLDSKNDKVQKVELSDGQKKIGLFSVLLTKNQGSFTRRLRSLTTMRYKIMAEAYDSEAVSPLEKVPLMTRMLQRHAGDPVGSPVMSFSTDIRVAGQFSSSGIVAVNIDKRRILPNFLGISSEFEMLVPLVVFPDEVVAYHESGNDRPLNNDRARLNIFLKEVQDKIKTQRLTVLPEQDVGILKTGFEIFKNATHEGPGALCRQIFK